MIEYRYRATTVSGEIREGELQGSSPLEVRNQLELEGLTVVSLRELRSRKWNISLSFYISRQEISFFTKNLAVMLGAGLTIVDALIIVEAQTGGRLRKIVHSILQEVESGHTLADSFSKFQRQFTTVYVDVIRTGELSGNLARNMQQLADRLENDLELRRKIRSAMIYPIIVLGAITGLGFILSIYVLPRLNRLFESLDVELPTTTRIMLSVSDFLSIYWVWIVIVTIACVILFRLSLAIPFVRTAWHHIILRLPIIGKTVRNINLARFTGTLGSLLQSGVPIAESLESVIHASGNEVYRKRLRECLQHIEQGGNLSTYIERHETLFTPSVARMVAVGERTGRLDAILLYLSNYFEVEVDTSTKQLGVTLEPLLLIVIGVVVAFVGLSVITPVYEFTASVGRF